MIFNPTHADLPITEVIDEVRNHLISGNTLIVNAPPGAGKSTLLPLALLDEPWLEGQKILMLEPRRLAARSIAYRMADLIQDEVGGTIGYSIRFDNRVSAKTKIEVVTEGILTRMLHSDNSLEGIGMIIFDEFHERSIHADLALALCREAQQVLRPDLKIMIMSATLDMPQLQSLIKAPCIISQGRQFPVEIKYSDDVDLMRLSEMTAQVIRQATKEHRGDVLAFFPGEGEIRKCEGLLKSQLPDFSIHPLYGQLAQNKQLAAIMPDKSGKRKVVLATSIAETSLTIEGIKIVVDTGYGRTSIFDPKSGLSKLTTLQISKDSADQRAGRAGRLSEGVCYRMWSKATDERLQKHREPEILNADLANLVLDLALWGVKDALELTWLSPPPKGAIASAKNLLEELGALENELITKHGRRIHQLPCHPRIAHMLLQAESMEHLSLATDIAALLDERDPLGREAGIDINIRIETLRRLRGDNRLDRNFSRIEKVAESYRRMFDIEHSNSPVDPYETGLVLTFAYPDRIACARPGNNAQFQLANGRYAMTDRRDDLANETWLAIANLDARDGVGKIFLASQLNPRDLTPLVKEQEVIAWDTKQGGLIASKDLRIGLIILQSQRIPNPNESKVVQAISIAIQKEGAHLLDWNEKAKQLQNRVFCLKHWNPSESWPDMSTGTLLSTNKEWLLPYLTQVKKNEDLKKLDLAEILYSSLTFNQQEELKRRMPERISVPSGSKVKLLYREDGEHPILSVRLQELFGMTDTPRINDGKNTVLIHMLSPGFKPVQITSDLKSFWDNTYFEIRKELKRRYPKHAWPEDPLKANAVSGVRRKK